MNDGRYYRRVEVGMHSRAGLAGLIVRAVASIALVGAMIGVLLYVALRVMAWVFMLLLGGLGAIFLILLLGLPILLLFGVPLLVFLAVVLRILLLPLELLLALIGFVRHPRRR